MIVTLGSRATVTLPAELRKALALEGGDPLDVTVQDGKLILTPVAIVPRSLFLSASGEGKEKVAETEVKAGKVRKFQTARQLVEDLHEDQ